MPAVNYDLPAILLPVWQKLKGNVKASPKKIYEMTRSEIVNIRDTYTKLEQKVASIQAAQDIEQKPILMVAVNVSTGNSNGTSAADPTLVGATIIGIISVGNQDQLVSNVDVESDGGVKVTLTAAATAQNNFKVAVMKA